jgi:hypothetical protein
MASKPPGRRVKIERLGGFAGFGMGHLRSEGEIDLEDLPEEERRAIERLLSKGGGSKGGGSKGGGKSLVRDAFRYRLSWEEDGESCSVEIDEGDAPERVRSAVTDKLV